MKKVNLSIIHKDIWSLETISFDKNISNFLTRIFKDNITIKDNKITSLFNIKNKNKEYFIIIDSKYNLLDLTSKVPNKFMIVCLDIKIIQEKIDNYKQDDIITLKEYLYNMYKIDILPNIELPKEKEIPKKFKISKQTINKIIKPSIIKYPIKPTIKKNITNRINILNKVNILPKVKLNKPILIKKNIFKSIIPKRISHIELKLNKTNIISKIKPKKYNLVKKNIFKSIIPKKTKQKKINIVTSVNKKIYSYNNKLKIKKNNKAITNKRIIINNNPISKKDNNSKTNKMNNHNKKLFNNSLKEIHMIVAINNNKPNKVITLFNNNTNKENVKKDNKKKKSINISISNKTSRSTIKIKKEKSKPEKNKKVSNDIDIREEVKKEDNNQSIKYTILSPTNEVLYHKELSLKEPITVADLLINSGLDIINTQGFIESINGISNKGMSGWVFEVNNTPVMVSASEYIINPNEQITWKYIDFSKQNNNEEQTIDTKKIKRKVSISKNIKENK